MRLAESFGLRHQVINGVIVSPCSRAIHMKLLARRMQANAAFTVPGIVDIESFGPLRGKSSLCPHGHDI